MSLVEQYRAHTEERAGLCIPPLPLTAEQARLLIDLLRQDNVQEKEYLLEKFFLHLLAKRHPLLIVRWIRLAFLKNMVF